MGPLLWVHGTDITKIHKSSLPASIAGVCQVIIYAMLCNANWMLTAISIIVTVASTLTYY